jgi:hypothetical protein
MAMMSTASAPARIGRYAGGQAAKPKPRQKPKPKPKPKPAAMTMMHRGLINR